MSPLPLLQPGRHTRGVLGQLRTTFRFRDNFNGDFYLWVVWSGKAFCLCSKLGFLTSLVEKNTGTHRDERKCTYCGGSLAGCLAHSRPSLSIPSGFSFPALLECWAHWCLDGDFDLGLLGMGEPTPYGLPFLLFPPRPCWRTHCFLQEKYIWLRDTNQVSSMPQNSSPSVGNSLWGRECSHGGKNIFSGVARTMR